MGVSLEAEASVSTRSSTESTPGKSGNVYSPLGVGDGEM